MQLDIAVSAPASGMNLLDKHSAQIAVSTCDATVTTLYKISNDFFFVMDIIIIWKCNCTSGLKKLKNKSGLELLLQTSPFCVSLCVCFCCSFT